MCRLIAIILLFVLSSVSCRMDTEPSGYTWKEPSTVKDTAAPDIASEDTRQVNVEACLDYFLCIFNIQVSGGTVNGCRESADPEIKSAVDQMIECANQNCNDLDMQPGSEQFLESSLKDCLKFHCPEPLLQCLARDENDIGCKRYVVCEQTCNTGVMCDLKCMNTLSPDDIPSAIEYLLCKLDALENPSYEAICACGMMCDVKYPNCK